MSGLGRLDGGQDGGEVRGLVVGELALGDLAAGGLDALLEFIGHALAVGGAVVDDRDGLAVQALDGIAAQRAAQVHVVSHDAEGRLVALAGVLGVGGRGRDLRNAGVGVDLGGRDGGAGVQVADHRIDLGVHQLLGRGGALLRVAGIVFGQQFELGLLAADGHALGVELIHGHAGAVFVVLAQVGNATAGRAHVTDLDHQFLRLQGAGQQGRSGRDDHIQFDLHRFEPPVGGVETLGRGEIALNGRDDTPKKTASASGSSPVSSGIDLAAAGLPWPVSNPGPGQALRPSKHHRATGVAPERLRSHAG